LRVIAKEEENGEQTNKQKKNISSSILNKRMNPITMFFVSCHFSRYL